MIFVVVGGATLAWAMVGSFTRRRPLDVLCAAIAPVAFLLALLGAVLIFVPGFLG